jgi:hypothetical protein
MEGDNKNLIINLEGSFGPNNVGYNAKNVQNIAGSNTNLNNKSILDVSAIGRSILNAGENFKLKIATDVKNLMLQQKADAINTKDALQAVQLLREDLGYWIENQLAKEIRQVAEEVCSQMMDHLYKEAFPIIEHRLNTLELGGGALGLQAPLFNPNDGNDKGEVDLFLEYSRTVEEPILMGNFEVNQNGSKTIYGLETKNNQLRFKDAQRNYTQVELGQNQVFFNKLNCNNGDVVYQIADAAKGFDMDKFMAGKFTSIRNRFNPRIANDGRGRDYYYVLKYNKTQIQFLRRMNKEKDRFNHKHFFIRNMQNGHETNAFSIFISRMQRSRPQNNGRRFMPGYFNMSGNSYYRPNTFRQDGVYGRREPIFAQGRGGFRGYSGRPRFFNNNPFRGGNTYRRNDYGYAANGPRENGFRGNEFRGYSGRPRFFNNNPFRGGNTYRRNYNGYAANGPRENGFRGNFGGQRFNNYGRYNRNYGSYSNYERAFDSPDRGNRGFMNPPRY